MITDNKVYESFLDLKLEVEEPIKNLLLGYTISKGKDLTRDIDVKGYRKPMIKRLTSKTLYLLSKNEKELIEELIKRLPEDNSLVNLHLAFKDYYIWLEKKLLELMDKNPELKKLFNLKESKEFEKAIEEVMSYLDDYAIRLANKIEKEVLKEILPKRLVEVENKELIINLYNIFSTLAKGLKEIKRNDNWLNFLLLVLMIRLVRVLNNLDNEENFEKELELLKEVEFLTAKTLTKNKRTSEEFNKLLKEILVSVKNE